MTVRAPKLRRTILALAAAAVLLVPFANRQTARAASPQLQLETHQAGLGATTCGTFTITFQGAPLTVMKTVTVRTEKAEFTGKYTDAVYFSGVAGQAYVSINMPPRLRSNKFSYCLKDRSQDTLLIVSGKYRYKSGGQYKTYYARSIIIDFSHDDGRWSQRSDS